MKKMYWVGKYTGNTKMSRAVVDDEAYKELVCAMLRETVKEYFELGTTAEKKAVIIKDLRSEYCEFISGGLSVYLAEQLVKNPEAVHERFRKEYYDDLDEETEQPLVDYDDLLMEMQEQM